MALSRELKQEILDGILSADNLEGRSDLVSFLSRVWPLAQMPSTDDRFKDAAGDIWQHMVNNSDWSVEELLVSRLSTTVVDRMRAEAIRAFDSGST